MPGKPLFFATAVPIGRVRDCGVLVESHMGRPTKIEGNPTTRPAWGRPTPSPRPRCSSLYDPDRSQVVTHDGRIDTWERLPDARPSSSASSSRRTRGAGLRILTETVTSPTLADQLRRLLEQFPEAKWHSYEPVDARRRPRRVRGWPSARTSSRSTTSTRPT